MNASAGISLGFNVHTIEHMCRNWCGDGGGTGIKKETPITKITDHGEHYEKSQIVKETHLKVTDQGYVHLFHPYPIL